MKIVCPLVLPVERDLPQKDIDEAPVPWPVQVRNGLTLMTDGRVIVLEPWSMAG